MLFSESILQITKALSGKVQHFLYNALHRVNATVHQCKLQYWKIYYISSVQAKWAGKQWVKTKDPTRKRSFKELKQIRPNIDWKRRWKKRVMMLMDICRCTPAIGKTINNVSLVNISAPYPPILSICTIWSHSQSLLSTEKSTKFYFLAISLFLPSMTHNLTMLCKVTGVSDNFLISWTAVCNMAINLFMAGKYRVMIQRPTVISHISYL